VTDLKQLDAEYTAFINAEKDYLSQIDPANAEAELNRATYAALLMTVGYDLLNQDHHIKLMQATQLGSAPLARVIMGRVRMTSNVAYRFQQATGIPVDEWLRIRAVREEPAAAQGNPDGQQPS
jgi:hypothetical protein